MKWIDLKITALWMTVILALFKGYPAEAKEVSMEISSAAFVHESTIPQDYTCGGTNISPPLTWKKAPSQTKSFALIMDDPDAPAGTWVHWVIFNIPKDKNGLAGAVPVMEQLSDGTRQGKNSFRETGYGGPCPPQGHGPHRYFFRLYALDTVLDLPQGANCAVLEAAMKGHILDRAEMMGRFERRP